MSATKEHYHNEIEEGMRKNIQHSINNSQSSNRKEKPILFSAPMVQAILEGRKTQTRRVIKDIDPNSKHIYPYDDLLNYGIGFSFIEPDQFDIPEKEKMVSLAKCRYGKPGDLLWVRETTAFTVGEHQPYDTISYKADSFHKDINRPGVNFPEDEMCKNGWHDKDLAKVLKWTPSIHVKKIFARIWLEVTEINVERLQDISEQDAIAEGIQKYGPFGEYAGSKHPNGGNMTHRAYYKASRAFECIWESINGEKSWRKNPWVWVVKFRVLSTTGKENIQPFDFAQGDGNNK